MIVRRARPLQASLQCHCHSRLLSTASEADNSVCKPCPSDSAQSAAASSTPDSVDAVVLTDAASGHPVGDVVSLIHGFHDATGLPWWATLCLTALGI